MTTAARGFAWGLCYLVSVIATLAALLIYVVFWSIGLDDG